MPDPRKDDPARLLLHRWILEQTQEVADLDPVVRRGGDDGVHGLRQACRRLRAALATYRPLVDRAVTDPLREELRWLARSLGSARDDEVVAERIAARLAAEGGPDALTGPAHDLLETYAAGRAGENLADVTEVLDSPRYRALRAGLDALAEEPPWTEAAERPARDVLPERLAVEWRRIKRLHRDSDDPHQLRRAAKRLRYAFELVEPAWGEPATQPRTAARELTRVLGDAQDSVVARTWLEQLAAEAARTGVPSYSFGRLHALEEQGEREALLEGERVWRELRKAVSRWS